MSQVYIICESKNYDYHDLMVTVETFVDSITEDATVEIYNATAKRFLGEQLTHEELMMEGVPAVFPSDLIVERRTPKVDDFKFNVSPNTSLRVVYNRLKLGRKGLEELYARFEGFLQKLKSNESQVVAMVQAGQLMGIDAKQAQLVLTKMVNDKYGKKSKNESWNPEDYDLLSEEGEPTNTSGSATPDHKPTDGDQRLGTEKVKKRKKLNPLKESTMKKFDELVEDLKLDEKKENPFAKKGDDDKKDSDDGDGKKEKKGNPFAKKGDDDKKDSDDGDDKDSDDKDDD